MSVQSHNFNARYTYDISVVVPVYNRQDFIPALVRSLDRQTARKKQFEVIFINDGSTDESLRRLNDAIQTHENYVLINQENKGVSAARNAGMRAARGRYIMFLDPDDTISRTTIKNIVAAFDLFGDTTDVVTYPILYHHLDTGRINRHKRWNWLNKTGVYSLQEFPHIVQTTMNVCIRNKGKDAIYFPEDLAFHEDEYFIAQNLIEKATIGFCVDATYHYYRHDTGAVALKNYALFSFNDIMQFFEMCLNVACTYERMRDYMYALVVYNVWVRYSSNLLFPDFGDEQTKAKNYKRLQDALKAVPLHAWTTTPYLNDFQKAYFIKNYLEMRPSEIIYCDKKTYCVFANKNKSFQIEDENAYEYILEANTLQLIIHWFVVEADVIVIKGRAISAASIFEDNPRLVVCVGDKKYPCELSESSYSFNGSTQYATDARNFSITISRFEALDAKTCSFEYYYGKMRVPLKISYQLKRHNAFLLDANTRLHFAQTLVETCKDFLSFSHHVSKALVPVRVTTLAGFAAAKVQSKFKKLQPDYTALFKAQVSSHTYEYVLRKTRIKKPSLLVNMRAQSWWNLVLGYGSALLSNAYLKKVRTVFDVVFTRFALKARLTSYRDKQIWIYNDLPGAPLYGNALAQFLHDKDNNDGIIRKYITNCSDNLLRRYPRLDSHDLVAHGSHTHLDLFLSAQIIISSYLETSAFMPCDTLHFNAFADVIKRQRWIYLQHGILHAHMPQLFSRDRVAFDYEVVSTQFEIENLTDQYGFAHEDLITSGAPVHDAISLQQKAKKKIIYAPSWRSYLIGGKAGNRISLGEVFFESAFYLGLKAFLEEVSQRRLLEAHGFTLELKLHPHLAAYLEGIVFDMPQISLAPDIVDPSEYALMITDYSSYVFDFVYANSRILYFLPDAEEFYGGLNHYSQLDLPLDEAFGPYTTNAHDACGVLEKMLTDICNETGDVYAARKENFFLHYDGQNQDRLYKSLDDIANRNSET